MCCGAYHSAAISADGRLFTWGDGMCGKLGHGELASRSEPRQVQPRPLCTGTARTGGVQTPLGALTGQPGVHEACWSWRAETSALHNQTSSFCSVTTAQSPLFPPLLPDGVPVLTSLSCSLLPAAGGGAGRAPRAGDGLRDLAHRLHCHPAAAGGRPRQRHGAGPADARQQHRRDHGPARPPCRPGQPALYPVQLPTQANRR